MPVFCLPWTLVDCGYFSGLVLSALFFLRSAAVSAVVIVQMTAVKMFHQHRNWLPLPPSGKLTRTSKRLLDCHHQQRRGGFLGVFIQTRPLLRSTRFPKSNRPSSSHLQQILNLG